MGVTYDIQTREFPTTDTHDLAHDGAPLSSRLGIDLMTGVNNLAYTDNFAGYVQSFNTKNVANTWEPMAGFVSGFDLTVAHNTEYFLAQVPTVLPLITAARLRWTLGIYPGPVDDSTGAMTIASINVYISPWPYMGSVGAPSLDTGDGLLTTIPFDSTKLGTPYGKTSNACNIVVANPTPTPGYFLVDDSAGSGVSEWTPGTASPSGSVLAKVNLIVTANISHVAATSGEGVMSLKLADFTWWVTPE